MTKLTMSIKLSLICFLIFIRQSGLSLACPQHQKEALFEFKLLTQKSLSRSLSMFETWNLSSDCCKWDGVTCGFRAASQQVSRLDLGYAWGPDMPPGFVISSNVLAPLFNIQTLVSLYIHYMGIQGEIPRTGFANLTELVDLDMTGNNFHGTIPVEIGNLTRLRYLQLAGNFLSGSIPTWILNLKELQELHLEDNSFSGEIPIEIGSLQNVSSLSLSYNNLKGRFPNWIHDMQKLESLRLENNSLSGEIPEQLLKMKKLTSLGLGGGGCKLTNLKIIPGSNLKHLYLEYGIISGRIPLWISNLTYLEVLSLQYNNLEGVLPQWLAELNLFALYLSYNKLSGSIPPRLFQSQRLTYLFLQVNNFSGELPDTIGEAKALTVLDLSGNRISGRVPKSISNLRNLTALTLSSNNLSGEMELAFDQDSNLISADLSDNRLSGKVPSMFPKGLRVLNLAQNEFKGHLPQKLGSLSLLFYLDLHNNNISGEIPMFLSQLASLRFLNLRNNSFEGSLPRHLSHLDHLQILDLSQNYLHGQIPLCFGNFSAMVNGYDYLNYSSQPYDKVSIGETSYYTGHDLQVIWKSYEENLPRKGIKLYTLLDLSGNQLLGEIPMKLGRLKHLKALNISGNKLSGTIPVVLGDMQSLESLDLSHNYLSGHIPESFTKLMELTSLDLSNNNLTGQIPSGPQMDRFNDPNDYANNSGLCGPQIQVPCEETREQTRPEEKTSTGSEARFSWEMAGIGYAVGFFLTILVTYSVGYFTAPQACEKHVVRRRRR